MTLLTHIPGACGLFALIGLEQAVMARPRRARTVGQVRARLEPGRPVEKAHPRHPRRRRDGTVYSRHGLGEAGRLDQLLAGMPLVLAVLGVIIGVRRAG